MKRLPKFAPLNFDHINFDGGLDLDTPALYIPKTFVRKAQNFELGVQGGYRRTAGYERFDGRPAPSKALYAILNATITGSFAVGNTLTGATSGATGVIAVAGTTTYFVITKVTGTFQNGETLNISGLPVGTASGTQITDGAATAKLHAQYKHAAANIYRTDILAVPGSGNVLGVVQYNDVVYVFRNNTAGTAAAIYRSSATGWVNVPLGEEVAFTGGNASVNDGDTLTQGAVTATIKRVVVTTGDPNAGTAAGRLVIHGRAGGSFAAGAATSTGGGTLTLSGAETAITLNPGGRYEFWIEDFGVGKRVYGCSGANRGFEFDGTDFGYVPITTGMNPDMPSHVIAHKKHLFFSFGASVQHSGIGTPYKWTLISGAAEINQGDTVNAFIQQPGAENVGGALLVLSRNRISVLYGSSSADWNFVTYADEQGAYAYTAQRLGSHVLMLDDRGLTSLNRSIAYGNFVDSTLSQRIESFVKQKRLVVKASCVSRNSSQWRIFFSDGYALYVTWHGNKMRGIMPMLFPHSVTCIHSSELSDGEEAIYFGSTNGFVYRMDSGTSFDGADIEAFIHLAFNPSKNVRQKKRYHRAMLECQGSGYAEFSFNSELGYASAEIPQPDNQNVIFQFTPANWDSAVWDSFIWDGVGLSPASIPLTGRAENISVIIRSIGNYFTSSTFSGVIIHYTPGRVLRSV